MKSKREESRSKQWCPYCDEEIENTQLPYCQPCKVPSFKCPACKQVVPREEKICPNCGALMKGESEAVTKDAGK
jgi:RNA polymerase subunit RPABC4/transcription elongation factor Spt4